MSDLFGEWQTEPYSPPIAQNGIVPKNEFGNVYLFQPNMIPIGTVHLREPGIGRLCRKLQIDYASAMVDWNLVSEGHSVPKLDGIVVCSEYGDLLMQAWEQEQQKIEMEKAQKRHQKALSNWIKLTKGLLIRESLKEKYSSHNNRTPSSSQEFIAKKTDAVVSIGKIGQLTSKEHQHQFEENYNQKKDEWTKQCSCGISIPFEKL